MADAKHEIVFSCYISVLMAIVYMLSHQIVEGRHVLVEKHSDLKHKGTVKTIVSEDGDVIDCVDFYKQPAFDDPLIKKNIQIMPSSYPSGMQSDSTQPKLTQHWHKDGECPEGTIPIRRTHEKHDNHKALQFHSHKLQPNQNILGHEYATVSTVNGEYHGAHASINVWNPKIEVEGGFSLSQIWMVSNWSGDINSIEVGWMVFPSRYKDARTRLFIYWTRDNYRNTGCYDLDCPGFVQTNRKFALGSSIWPISTYGGQQFDITLTVHKDKNSGNWWLRLQDVVLGYWPSTIFTSLANSAVTVQWGGEVTSGGSHATAQMGSSHFPSEGFGKSSFFRNLGAIDSSDTRRDPVNLIPLVTSRAYYDLKLSPNTRTGYGTFFYYGGPGFSP